MDGEAVIDYEVHAVELFQAGYEDEPRLSHSGKRHKGPLFA